MITRSTEINLFLGLDLFLKKITDECGEEEENKQFGRIADAQTGHRLQLIAPTQPPVHIQCGMIALGANAECALPSVHANLAQRAELGTQFVASGQLKFDFNKIFKLNSKPVNIPALRPWLPPIGQFPGRPVGRVDVAIGIDSVENAFHLLRHRHFGPIHCCPVLPFRRPAVNSFQLNCSGICQCILGTLGSRVDCQPTNSSAQKGGHLCLGPIRASK